MVPETRHVFVVVAVVLLVLLVYHAWDQDCYEEYQTKECYLRANSKECEQLYNCIRKEEDPNYKEYLLTLLAGALFLLKRYGVEMRDIYRRMRA